jgi:hypothetical protein
LLPIYIKKFEKKFEMATLSSNIREGKMGIFRLISSAGATIEPQSKILSAGIIEGPL